MPSRSGAAPSRPFILRRALRPFAHIVSRLFIALLLTTLLPLGLGRPTVALAAGDLSVKVYVDAGRDGVDSGGAEPGLAGAAVAVYSADDRLVALANTNGAGAAVFPGLPDGDYRVEVTPLSGYVVSVPGADTNPGLVSRVSVAGGAAMVSVGVRQLSGGMDAEAGSARSITTRVWDDRDADGVQDADEPGVDGLTLQLLDSTGAPVQTAVAGADGRYRFDTAPPGVGYSVRIGAGIPAGYTLTAGDRARDGIDSDAALGIFPPPVASVPGGAVGVNTDAVDIGLAQGAISGAVWRDLNSDGDYDPASEPRINGVTVELVQDGAVIATAATRAEQGDGGADGVFRFAGLPFGSYSVRVPNGEFQAGAMLFGAANSPTSAGSDDQAQPDGMPGAEDVTLGPITLSSADVAAGSNRFAGAEFGFYQGAAGDFVWFDLDRNGAQDQNELALGVNGVTLFVDDGRGGGVADNGLRDGGEIATVTGISPLSGLPGFYRFDGLPLGASYRVALDSGNFAPGGPLEGFGSSTATPGATAGGDPYFYRTATLNTGAASDLGLDFGLTRSDLGNLVFTDVNGDGLFNPGETPIPGVTVRIFRQGSATPLYTALTDAGGFYTIPNIPALTYYATFDLATAGIPTNDVVGSLQPAGISVDPAETSNPGVDYSDLNDRVNATTWITPLFTPAAGAPNNGVDAGFYQLTTVSGRAFFDADGDDQDEAPPEPGVGNVMVNLLRSGDLSVVASTTTANDGSGAYSFAFVAPGSYVVEFVNPPSGAYRFVAPNLPAAGDPLASDVIDSATGRTAAVTVLSGAAASELDAGFAGRGQVSGRVFFDRDLDGLRALEPGVQGVSVRLLDGATVVSTTTTLASGAYSFSNLLPGDYTVEFVNPDAGNFAFVAGGDSDVSAAGLTGVLPISGSLADIDAGMVGLATVSGQAFADTDGDGLRDESPAAPLDGTQVTLTQAVNIPGRLSTTITRVYTTAGGAGYSFNGLPGGAAGQADFSLSFAPPTAAPAWQATLADVGADDGIDSDGNLTGQALAAGATESRDQGFYQPVTITARVFRESALPLNNQWDAGEAGIAGVSVVLEALPGNTPVQTQATNAAGLVSFSVRPGAYRLVVDEASAALAGLVAAPGNGGAATASGSPFQSGASSLTETANPGTTNVFGYYQNITITARVFDEQVAVDNAPQGGEPGLAGVTVNLTGDATASAATDATGTATFTVEPGSYGLAVAADPAGFTRSPGNGGSVSLGAVSASPAPAAFGYYRTSIIAGSAWYDSDGDGARDVSEPPMEGPTVELRGDVSGLIASDALDATGAYGFSAVDPSGLSGGDSSYRLCFALPAGLGFTQKGPLAADDNSDANPADGCTDPFTLGSNQTLSTVDAGYRGALTVGDLVWEDLDADGVQDSGERGLAGVTVTVAFTSAGGVINSTNPTVVVSATTTASGSLTANYQLRNVPPASGWEVLSVTAPFGYKASPSDAGADDAADSDPLGSYTEALAASRSDLDFGFYQATAVGDRVWLDLDGNGLYDADADLGVPGVTVELLQGGAVAATTTTAGGEQAGSYSFVDVEPGTYSLRFTAPAGYIFVNNGAGSITADNDNDARLDGTTAEFSLASGQARAGLDAGLRGTAGLSGIVWVDEDRDGVRDDSDTGRIEGVNAVLTLTPDLTPGATATFTATSAADGSYAFTGLPAGAGELRFGGAPGYIAVPANVGGDEQRDSDGPVAQLTLSAGAALEGVDQGYRERGRMIWLPMMFGEPLKPDLAVSFAVSPTSPTAGKDTSIAVTVTNRGTGPASGFWVDFYINPAHAPAVNERWDELCTLEPCFGLAWFYEGTLQPGESVTLNSRPQSAANPHGYKVESSTWPGFFANGTRRLYALADSWNRGGDAGDPNGALREIDETNNRAEQTIEVGLGPLPPEYSQLRFESLLVR